jgi:hypothetical protein
MSNEDFDRIYNIFDQDGDGEISYNDFHLTLGNEISPAEGLYFRQDKSRVLKQKKCLEYQCWAQTLGNGSYCSLHSKMYLHQ